MLRSPDFSIWGVLGAGLDARDSLARWNLLAHGRGFPRYCFGQCDESAPAKVASMLHDASMITTPTSEVATYFVECNLCSKPDRC